MKKALLFLTLLPFSFHLSPLSAQSWKWGVQPRNNNITPGNGESYGICTDKYGNSYATGTFSDTLYFQYIKLYSDPYEGNPYIVKYDSNGNLIWAQQGRASGTAQGGGYSICVDSWGNVYATGWFIDTMSFGPYTLSYVTRYTNGGYLVKYNSNGNLIWAQKFDSPLPLSLSNGTGIACDKLGRIYVTGEFAPTMICGADTLKCGSRAGANVFIVKYDTAGHVIWARQSNCLVSWAYGESVAVDNDYNVYVAGYFADTTSFGSYQLTDSKKFGGKTVFLTKYDSAGNILWATQDNNSADTSAYAACGTYAGPQGGVNCLATDKEENAYITGHFQGMLKFGSHTLSSDSVAPYLVKYDQNGNVLWAEQGHRLDSNGWVGYSVAADTLNRIYLTAGTWDNYDVNFDYDTKIVFDKDTFKSNGANPTGLVLGVLVEFDAAGNSLCGSMISSVDEQNLIVSCASSGKYINLGGSFTDTTIFGKDTLLLAHPALPFMARWEPCPGDDLTGIEKQEIATEEIKVYPNPSNGLFTLSCHTELVPASQPKVQVYNVLGEPVYNATLKQV